MTSNKLIEAINEDEERKSKLEDCLQNIENLNLTLFELDCDNEKDDSVSGSQEDHFNFDHYDIKGINFINLQQPINSVSDCDFVINEKDVQMLKTSGKLKKLGFNDGLDYLCKVLFSNLNEELLDVCSSHFVDYINKRNFSEKILCTFHKSLDELGGNSMKLEKPIAEDYSFIVDKNLSYIIKSLNYLLNECLYNQFEVSCGILNSLLLTYMKISMDNHVISSEMSNLIYSEITIGIKVILRLFDDARFIDIDLPNIVNSLGEYLNSFDSYFPYQATRHLCMNIIPNNNLGIMLKKSIAYYSLLCCLPSDSDKICNKITISMMESMLRSYADIFNEKSFIELYSMLYLIDICISNSTLENESVTALEGVIQITSSVIRSRGASPEDVGLKLLNGLFILLKNSWLALSKQIKIKQLSNSHQLTSDDEMDIY